HAANHLVFALAGRGLAFSGDHVMGWSTTVVAPPDGSMADYMASLDRLLQRPERRYLPGHGDPVDDAHARLRALKAHRAMREAAILDRLAKGDATVPAVVSAIYRDVDPRLHGAAALSVLAHLQDLAERGKIVAEDGATLAGRYRPA
ncbi:MAG: MBL fold metallo-hydrolase, partial [Bauldia sp.]|nr:MBL fold metallo-hydrolase [Bauldia sp.]